MIENKNKLNLVILGIIKSAYGIQGWVKLLSFTELGKNIFNYKPWFIRKNNSFCIITPEKWSKIKHNLFLVKIKDTKDRTQALKLIKKKL